MMDLGTLWGRYLETVILVYRNMDCKLRADPPHVPGPNSVGLGFLEGNLKGLFQDCQSLVVRFQAVKTVFSANCGNCEGP
jgi:hypothetical protein